MPRFLLLTAFLFALGCSSGPKSGEGGVASRADELREVAGLIAAHSGKGRKAAPTPAELASYEAAFPLGVKVIRAGEVTVSWGIRPAEEGEVAAGRGGNEIIAYEKKAPTDGGWVILQDGNVKEMTAAEFGSAPKAK